MSDLQRRALEELETAGDPWQLFSQWMNLAEASEPNDPNAAALATATSDGRPSVRMVLVKRVEDPAFGFFTNDGSQKGEQLHANPHAALCFHWKSLRRQVRTEGAIVPMPDEEVDTYFHSRSRRSQVGSAVSQQSRPLESRAVLEEQLKEFEEAHPGEVPRPPQWRGYRLQAARMEFWLDGPHRLHDRFLFTLSDGGAWQRTRLYP